MQIFLKGRREREHFSLIRYKHALAVKDQFVLSSYQIDIHNKHSIFLCLLFQDFPAKVDFSPMIRRSVNGKNNTGSCLGLRRDYSVINPDILTDIYREIISTKGIHLIVLTA